MSCVVCSSSKTTHACRSCEGDVCKKCVQFVGPDRIAFLEPSVVESLTGAYCMTCYDSKAAAVVSEYDELMERAGDVTVYFIEQGKETRLIKRQEKKISIDSCEDRNETIMRLAFRAAKNGFNGLVDVDLTYEKHREGSFKIANWKGTAIPVKLDDRNRPRDSSLKSPSR